MIMYSRLRFIEFVGNALLLINWWWWCGGGSTLESYHYCLGFSHSLVSIPSVKGVASNNIHTIDLLPNFTIKLWRKLKCSLYESCYRKHLKESISSHLTQNWSSNDHPSRMSCSVSPLRSCCQALAWYQQPRISRISSALTQREAHLTMSFLRKFAGALHFL